MEIEKYEYPKLELFYLEDHIMTINNPVELYRVQIEITKKQVEGYNVRFNGRKITVFPNGDLSDWPIGMYDQEQRCFSELHKLRNM